jgi:hypothetical protein
MNSQRHRSLTRPNERIRAQYSPTPVPRRKLPINSASVKRDNFNKLSFLSTPASIASTKITANATSTDPFVRIDLNYSFAKSSPPSETVKGQQHLSYSSSTMPLPRKPRKSRLNNSSCMNQTNPECSITVNETQVNSSRCNLLSNMTTGSTSSPSCSSRSGLDTNESIRSLINKIDLKRPSVPPPPLPCAILIDPPQLLSPIRYQTDSSSAYSKCNRLRLNQTSWQAERSLPCDSSTPKLYSAPKLFRYDEAVTNSKLYCNKNFNYSIMNRSHCVQLTADKDAANTDFKRNHIGFERYEQLIEPGSFDRTLDALMPSRLKENHKNNGEKKREEKFSSWQAISKIKEFIVNLFYSRANDLESSTRSNCSKQVERDRDDSLDRSLSFVNSESLSNALIAIFCLLFFCTCIGSIVMFQMQVHSFYKQFFDAPSADYIVNATINKTNVSDQHDEYQAAGFNMVKSTLLFCNGPYFTYQMNNLITLPFSLALAIVFSFFGNKKQTFYCSCSSKKIKCNRCSKKRPALHSSANPFRRRNRFFVAALFCILANEIFKMIESSMFSSSESDSTSSGQMATFNKTSELFNLLLSNNRWRLRTNSSSPPLSTDLLAIGLGIQPALIYKQTQDQFGADKPLSVSAGVTGVPQLSSSSLVLAPSVLKYSKPRLPPRLIIFDLETTATTTKATTSPTDSSDEAAQLDEYDKRVALGFAQGLHKARLLKNKTSAIVSSFNETLRSSSNQTLFEFSMSIYRNEYVQNAVKSIFKSRSLKWAIVYEKLEKLLIMMLEVLIIGMRYYPLLGVLDKNSLVCLLLACIYMWSDTIYNVAITGLCEGLKLNVDFDSLKELRRVFGVGFVLDIKESLTIKSKYLASMGSTGLTRAKDSGENQEFEIDSKLLFSTSRIVYATVKSLPHFFCLSYVTIKLSFCLVDRLYGRFKRRRAKKNLSTMDLLVDVKQSEVVKTKLSFVYTKKYTLEQKKFNTSHIKCHNDKELSFEDNYVRSLFSSHRVARLGDDSCCMRLFNGFYDKNFRFSTRIVCTFTVCFTLLYYLTCFLLFYGFIFVDLIYLPPIYKYSIVATTTLTSLICAVQLILSMRQIKIHLQSLYKGTSDKYIKSKDYFSNKKIATSSFNYAGYTVTYTCWGYIIMFVVFTFISFQIATLIAFGGGCTLGLLALVILLPFAVSFLVARLFNRFIGSLAAKYFFMQRKSKVLALKNLKTYSLFLYFKFFYDCFTGIAFCLLRMLSSLLMGILFMSRLDYSFMGNSMERMDTAFMSYIGYLHWESHHTNPVAISFCDLLQKMQQRDSNLAVWQRRQATRRTRIVNRWQMAYLLLKNKTLVRNRRQ